jgi:4-hydroxy-tetrahydrodipicolinate reductase
MRTLRIAVAGASGRMGQELVNLILAEPTHFQLAAALSRKAKGPAVSRLEDLDAQQVDVVIDFSSPDYFTEILKWCEAHQKPLVSGTTGFSTSARQDLNKAAQHLAILHSPNMSLGVAVVNEMIRLLSCINHFDFAIEELHHRFKKDAPSGTALQLKQTLEAAIGKDCATASIRGGGIYGVHRILAMGLEETVTVEHTALNRTVFASGALRAAQWLMVQPHGLYSISDVLSLS